MQATNIPLLGKCFLALVGAVQPFMPVLGHGFPNIDGDNIDGSAVLEKDRSTSYAWRLVGTKM